MEIAVKTDRKAPNVISLEIPTQNISVNQKQVTSVHSPEGSITEWKISLLICLCELLQMDDKNASTTPNDTAAEDCGLLGLVNGIPFPAHQIYAAAETLLSACH